MAYQDPQQKPTQASKIEQIPGWDSLPLEISRMILDCLDWTSHRLCRQVCHAWREYLDEPRNVSKRYHAPQARPIVKRRIRNLDGTVETYDVVPIPAVHSRQIHRMFSGDGIGFFVANRDIPSDADGWPGHFYIFDNARERFGQQDVPSDWFDAKLGKLVQNMLVDEARLTFPATPSRYPNEIYDIPQATTLSAGFCHRYRDIPFGDEIAVKTRCDNWEVYINGRASHHLANYINIVSLLAQEPLTVKRLLEAIRKGAAMALKFLTKDFPWDSDTCQPIFVKIYGIYNVNLPDRETLPVTEELNLHIDLIKDCRWEVYNGDEEEEDWFKNWYAVSDNFAITEEDTVTDETN